MADIKIITDRTGIKMITDRAEEISTISEDATITIAATIGRITATGDRTTAIDRRREETCTMRKTQAPRRRGQQRNKCNRCNCVTQKTGGINKRKLHTRRFHPKCNTHDFQFQFKLLRFHRTEDKRNTRNDESTY